MTCDSLECYYESKRVERRVRRLRALADGYRAIVRRARRGYLDVLIGPYVIGARDDERARIVAIVRRELKDARRIGVNDFLWLDLLDEIERGE